MWVPTTEQVERMALECDSERRKARRALMAARGLLTAADFDPPEITDQTSDGFHTFAELYRFRLLYNAALFSQWHLSYTSGIGEEYFDVHKSKLHSDGELPFGSSDWFIVMATLPTGQISNHYQIEHWDLFKVPTRERAGVWDGHTAAEAADRLQWFLEL